jgi:hypothetical protein
MIIFNFSTVKVHNQVFLEKCPVQRLCTTPEQELLSIELIDNKEKKFSPLN